MVLVVCVGFSFLVCVDYVGKCWFLECGFVIGDRSGIDVEVFCVCWNWGEICFVDGCVFFDVFILVYCFGFVIVGDW